MLCCRVWLRVHSVGVLFHAETELIRIYFSGKAADHRSYLYAKKLKYQHRPSLLVLLRRPIRSVISKPRATVGRDSREGPRVSRALPTRSPKCETCVPSADIFLAPTTVMQEQPEALEMKRFQAPVENTQRTEPMPHQPNHVSDASQRLKQYCDCLLYTSPSPRDKRQSRMPSSA